MAGVTDRPFRQLCKQLGAGYAVSEMAASNPQLWATDKTTRRLNHEGEVAPIAVQIAGSDPTMMAQAAKFNAQRGAQIIDINMGCPAKKVCNVAAGSALLKHEDLVKQIIGAVVDACAPLNVPVTLKYRTGWSPEHKNALTIGLLAQSLGVQMLTLHGRTRACGYNGQAEYDTVKALKATVGIPVVVSGDITSPEKAQQVLGYTGADAIMIGRAAQGRPWIFQEIAHYLSTGEHMPSPLVVEVQQWMTEHLQQHYAFYGEFVGVRTARKHLLWYLTPMLGRKHPFLDALVSIESTHEQFNAVDHFFNQLAQQQVRIGFVADDNPTEPSNKTIQERLAA